MIVGGIALMRCYHCGANPRFVAEHSGDCQLFCPCLDDEKGPPHSPLVQRPVGQERELALDWNNAMAPPC